QTNIRRDPSQSARGIESPADHEVRIEEEQRQRRELADLDRRAPAESQRRMGGSEQFDRSERQACEAGIVRLDGVKQVLCEVNLATFEHRQALAPRRLDDFHLDVRKALRIAVQKLRKHAFDMLRRGGDDQSAGVAAPEKLRALADGGRVIQEAAAVAEKLFPRAGQDKAAPDSIEKPEAELALEVPDLTRQCRLGNAQL